MNTKLNCILPLFFASWNNKAFWCGFGYIMNDVKFVFMYIHYLHFYEFSIASLIALFQEAAHIL